MFSEGTFDSLLRFFVIVGARRGERAIASLHVAALDHHLGDLLVALAPAPQRLAVDRECVPAVPCHPGQQRAAGADGLGEGKENQDEKEERKEPAV